MTRAFRKGSRPLKIEKTDARPFISAVIPAAGRGQRMGTKTHKQFLKLQGEPILYWTIRAFDESPRVDEIVVILSPEDQELFNRDIAAVHTFKHEIKTAAGGETRSQSVYNGLKAADPRCSVVLIHDGARPMIGETLIRDSIDYALKYKAAIAAVPAKNTIKSVKPADDGSGVLTVNQTLERRVLYEVQTPQAFDYKLILSAYEAAAADHVEATDDAAFVERLGRPVAIIPGDYNNIKITTSEDLMIINSFLTLMNKKNQHESGGRSI